MDQPPQGADRRLFLDYQWKLSAAQVFSGVGIASGFAVGSLLAKDLTGSAEYGGFAQTASIVGAGVLAIPLARLAERTSRRRALSIGFGIAAVGALVILLGARLDAPVVFFGGMLLFGAASATGFQARYAATDVAPAHLRGRALSIVVWATTIGSVAGPNLVGVGGTVGRHLGVGELAGPYVLSLVAYLVAVVFTLQLRSASTRVRSDAAAPVAARSPARVRDGLRVVAGIPRALLGFVTVVLGQTVMVSVMVMTPLHMQEHGDTIRLIGLVISLHILGMYALSPVFGFLADRFGPVPVIWCGWTLFASAAVVGISDDVLGSSMPRIATALILLGLGWSACFIAGSTLLSASVPASHRVTVQGATDACMNLSAAIFAAAGGPLLTAGGFTLINIAALSIVAIGVFFAVRSGRASATDRSFDRQVVLGTDAVVGQVDSSRGEG